MIAIPGNAADIISVGVSVREPFVQFRSPKLQTSQVKQV